MSPIAGHLAGNVSVNDVKELRLFTWILRSLLYLCTVSVWIGLFEAVAFANCTTVSPCTDNPIALGVIGNVAGSSVSMGTNGDGSVAVGQSATSLTDQRGSRLYHAARWTRSGGVLDLGTIDNISGVSIATATNYDGSVVVGQSTTSLGDQFGNPLAHAFRWTSNGGMVDLGTIDHVIGNSRAQGVNSDGNVVVGFSLSPRNTSGSSYYNAFRWTALGGMVDLGTIRNTAGYSSANATNLNGSVVVGESVVPEYQNVFYNHAFYWTTTSGMVDLGTLGNVAGYSRATAVNSDGSVVVGQSTLPTDTGLVHAFRWTESTGMVDLGTPNGVSGTSRATGVSGNGAVVVGQYSKNCGECGEQPFRWTATSGMQDLNILLAKAGALPNAATLYSANGISTDGQYIVGNGNFGSDPAYIVRYADGSSTPIAGVATIDSLKGSVDGLSRARSNGMIQFGALAAPLLGSNQPLTMESGVSVFGAGGSTSGGSYGQVSNRQGLTLLGGIAYVDENFGSMVLKPSVTDALALRYLFGGSDNWKLFTEVGGWDVPSADLGFKRYYTTVSGTREGVGDTTGDLYYGYGRVGVALEEDHFNQFVVSFEAGREELHLHGYNESVSPANPFNAEVGSGVESLGLAKLRAQWSHKFSAEWDSTVWVALARDFEQSNKIEASLVGVGLVIPSGIDQVAWTEYGARVGFKFDTDKMVDAFVDGAAGDPDFGSHIHGGVELRVKF